MTLFLRRPRLFFGILLAFIAFPSWAGPRDSPSLQEIAALRQIQETQGRVLAETVQNLQLIRQEVQELKGAIEEARHFFEEGSATSEKLIREYDLRITGMEERLSMYENQLREFLAKPAAPTGIKGVAGEEESLYRQALTEINTQNYRGAMPLFDQFLQKFPKSTMADNAQYWKGESLYGLKQFQQAILEFQKVIQKYPKSEKVAAAVLKQGFCFFELKQHLDAKAFLQKVATDFPKSEEAGKAREKLQRVDQILAKGNAGPAPQPRSELGVPSPAPELVPTPAAPPHP